MNERTFFVWDDLRTVCDNWGYCHLWKQHLAKAEKLGYKLSNSYGFEVHTDTKKFVVRDKLTFESVMLHHSVNPNSIKDAQEIIKAWNYLKKRGYTTDYELVKTAKL